MTREKFASSAGLFFLELVILAAGVLLGAALATHVRTIPTWLLHLPNVDFGWDAIRSVLVAFVVACAATLLANRAISGADPFASPRRAAKEVYALVTGIVAAALYLFFLTTITFSPEFLLNATVITVVLFLLAFVAVLKWRRAARPLGQGSRFVGNLFLLLKSPWAWLIVLFALSPVVVAWRFTKDRDFANWVTQLRLAVNLKGDHPYELVNALGTQTFTTPIMMQFADADPRTIYVLTRAGQLWRADYPSGANARMLLDITRKVGHVESENGALGFDLHPEFGKEGSPNAGYVYIYFTEYRKDGQTNRLNRYDLRAPDPEARATSEAPLIAQERNNNGYHNAGSVEFGPDGFLYASMGEAFMKECHQRVDCALVGGIVRLDVDCKGGDISRPIARQPKNGQTGHYCIPLDNPYATLPDALGEFWAHGLRNPFRISFDRVTGALWAGDVGTTVWEEVNRIERGGNYQFPYIEGTELQKEFVKPPEIVGREVVPVLYYRHTAFLRSVIGGTVYRGDRLPDLKGKYVFNDNYSGEIMTIPADAPPLSTQWETVARAREVAQRGVTALVEAPDGQLLVSMMGADDQPTGVIARLVPADSPEATAERESVRAQAKAVAAQAGAGSVSAAQAKSMFNTQCGRCHGATGKGDGPDSQHLGTFVPDFTDANFQKWRTDDELLTAIRGGGPAVGRSPAMPPWKDALKPHELDAMRDYVRAFGGGDAARK